MKIAKMYLIIIPLIIMGGIICISCNPRQDKENNVGIRVNVNKAEAFDIGTIASPLKYIPLETKEDALIGAIDKLYVNEQSIIVFDRENKKILLFDKGGTFIRQIGTKGQGPDEYIEFGDIYYDPIIKKIYAFGRLQDKMFIYSLSGEIDKIIDSQFSFNSFIKGDEGFWIYGCFQNNPNKFQLLYVDENLSTIKKGYFAQTSFVNLAIESCFTEDNEENKYFYYPGANMIYQLINDKSDPFIVLDFEKHTIIPYEKIAKAKNREEYDKIVETTTDYVGFIENVHISPPLCILNCKESGLYAKKEIYKLRINLENNEVNVYNTYHNAPGSPSLLRLLYIYHGNELVYAITPQNLMDFEIEEVQKLIPSISVESNPILAFYKLK